MNKFHVMIGGNEMFIPNDEHLGNVIKQTGWKLKVFSTSNISWFIYSGSRLVGTLTRWDLL